MLSKKRPCPPGKEMDYSPPPGFSGLHPAWRPLSASRGTEGSSTGPESCSLPTCPL